MTDLKKLKDIFNEFEIYPQIYNHTEWVRYLKELKRRKVYYHFNKKLIKEDSTLMFVKENCCNNTDIHRYLGFNHLIFVFDSNGKFSYADILTTRLDTDVDEGDDD